MNDQNLSSRGEKAFKTVLRKDFNIFFQASQNLYDPVTNTDGVFTLNIAENVLTWPLLKIKIEAISATESMPKWVSSYTSCLGHPDFLSAIADFMSIYLTQSRIESTQLAVSAGATAVIEMTSWLLCDDGDVAVIPAPSYPVYSQDIGNKAGVERYDLITHHDTSEIQNGLILSLDHLNDAYNDIRSQGKRFRMLVLTSPDNPTGGMYKYNDLLNMADWCIEHDIHLIVNEIYGLSIIDHDLNRETYQSFAKIIHIKKSNYLHLWYSLSKDLGISGFRIGILHSLNERLIKAYDNLNAPHLVSNHTQWIMQRVLEDSSFMEGYILENQKRLPQSYHVVTEVLDKMEVPYAPALGSLFVWLDLSEFLESQSQEDEDKLWMEIYERGKILLTPGDGFGHTKKGMFRLVYSCVKKSHLEKAMKELEAYIVNKRKELE